MADPTFPALLVIAKKAARRSGRILRHGFRRTQDVSYKKSHYGAMVTDVDIAAEHIMRQTISAAYPGHAILGEEGGLSGRKRAKYLWILDPIDGTTNYVHGVPLFNTTVALRYNGRIVLGVTYQPMTRELYSAVRGHGVWMNRTPCQVSKTAALRKLFGLMEWGLRPPRLNERGMAIHKKLRRARVRVRAIGSSCLSSAYVAAGYADYVISIDSRLWDVAAGTLFVEESGGRVTDFAGKSIDHVWQKTPFATSALIATNGVAHEKLLTFVKQG
jgi:myo-inositol-1(or 4)-monophosphatase